MLYAMTGVRAISALNGCPGHTWEQRADKNDPHMSIDCPAVHEPHLAKDPLWSPSAAHVPLNDAEKKAADEADAERDKLAIKNSGDTAAVLAQTAALLAEISAKLNAAPVAEVPAAPEAPAPAAATAEPAKADTKTSRTRSKTPARASA